MVPPPTPQVIDCLDIDGDGQITYEEFTNFALHRPEGAEIGEIHAKMCKGLARYERKHGKRLDLRHQFARLDARRTGHVSTRDFETIVVELELGVSSRDAGELARRFDVNGNGFIDYDGFAHWLVAAEDVKLVEKKVR